MREQFSESRKKRLLTRILVSFIAEYLEIIWGIEGSIVNSVVEGSFSENALSYRLSV
jgi:hypothetical protein